MTDTISIRLSMTDTVSILLSWPEYTLWPNSRSHWAKLAKARREAKKAAYYTMKHHKLVFPPDAHIHLTYYPPTRRKFDMDNALGACKAYIDGMAEASRCDDSGWHISHNKGSATGPAGMIRVQLIIGTPVRQDKASRCKR